MIRKAPLAGFVVMVLLTLPIAANVCVAEEASKPAKDSLITIQLLEFGKDGKIILSNYFLTKEELKKLEKAINKIMETLTKSKDIDSIIEEITKELGNTKLSKAIEDVLKGPSKFKAGPIQKRAFIVSNGFGKRIDFRLLPKVRIFKPLTFWNYFGLTNYMKKSKTIIIDPYPPTIRVLHGWQIGMMRRFVGLYIRTTGSMIDKDHIFFIGYAYRVIAFDIPDPTNFQ